MSKILFVEDMAIFREPIAAALQKEGYRVFLASNGKEALSLVDFHIPDLILLDLSMPEMDGLTFLERMRENLQLRNVPVILLTAVAEKDAVLQAKQLNVKDYLVKSYFSLQQLLDCVNKYLKKPSPSKIEEPGKPAALNGTKIDFVQEHNSQTKKPPVGDREKTLQHLHGRTEPKTLPGAVQKVIALTGALMADPMELAAIVARDPILASQVLRAANTAAYGGAKGHTANLNDAVFKLGSRSVRDIAIAVGIFNALAEGSTDMVNFARCWEHCFAVASIMDFMIPKSEAEAKDLAYLVGLCHDLPELILRQEFPDQFSIAYKEAAEHGKNPWRAIEDVFGISYGELAEVVLSRFNLPESIIKPVQEYFNCNSELLVSGMSRCAQSLRIANWYAHGLTIASSLYVDVHPVRQDEYLLATGTLHPAEFSWDTFRTTVQTTTSMLAHLSPSQQTELSQPLLSKGDKKILHIRHDIFSSFDPVSAALTSLGEVTITDQHFQNRNAPEDSSLIIVTLPNITTNPESQESIDKIMEYVSHVTGNVLCLCSDTNTIKDLPGLKKQSFPISLKALADFAGS